MAVSGPSGPSLPLKESQAEASGASLDSLESLGTQAHDDGQEYGRVTVQESKAIEEVGLGQTLGDKIGPIPAPSDTQAHGQEYGSVTVQESQATEASGHDTRTLVRRAGESVWRCKLDHPPEDSSSYDESWDETRHKSHETENDNDESEHMISESVCSIQSDIANDAVGNGGFDGVEVFDPVQSYMETYVPPMTQQHELQGTARTGAIHQVGHQHAPRLGINRAGQRIGPGAGKRLSRGWRTVSPMRKRVRSPSYETRLPPRSNVISNPNGRSTTHLPQVPSLDPRWPKVGRRMAERSSKN